MQPEEIRKLAELALKARERAYIPYSHFAVGAAVLMDSGKVFQGCNIENLSYSATICAERTAIFKAVSEGEKKFQAIAVAGGPEGREPEEYCFPCAVCLQVMSEFFSPGTEIYIVRREDDYQTYHLSDLLPHVFDSLKV